jgi:hypothetical protein
MIKKGMVRIGLREAAFLCWASASIGGGQERKMVHDSFFLGLLDVLVVPV